MNPFASLQFFNRKVVISTAIAVMVVFVLYNRSDAYQIVSNSVAESVCSLEVINSPLTPQNDPCMISIIRKNYLVPPSTLPLNLDKPDVKNPSYGQSQKVLEILKDKKRGFFIEAGALNGESYSNTIFMERELEWEGLLVEANPASYAKVVSKHRRAWLLPAALSTSAYPKVVTFDQERVPDMSKINEFIKSDVKPGLLSVQCFPLYSILLALNQTTVDYFSLDIEGSELDVLRTIPWDKVDIKTLSVEFQAVKEGKDAVKTFMEGKGYTVQGEVSFATMANDFIFVKNVSI